MDHVFSYAIFRYIIPLWLSLSLSYSLCLGGICGGYFAALAGGHDACIVYTYVNAADHEPYEALFGELFYCTILVSINLHLATDKRTSGNQHYGMFI